MITYEIEIVSNIWEGSVFKNGVLLTTIVGTTYEEVEDEIIIKYFRGY